MKTHEELVAAATVVDTFEGMLHDNVAGDKYYTDVESFVDSWWYGVITDCSANTIPPDEYFLFCTRPIHPRTLCIGDIIEQIEEEAEVEDLDAADHLEDLDELAAALEAFNDANRGVQLGYEPDYTKIIRVTKADFEEGRPT